METAVEPLTLDELQRRVAETAIYPNRGDCLLYPLLGLADEVGETIEKVLRTTQAAIPRPTNDLLYLLVRVGQVAGLFKKAHRDGGGRLADTKALLRALEEAEGYISFIRAAVDYEPDGLSVSLPDNASLGVDAAAVGRELGDAVWYLPQVATELGLSMDALAGGMLAKLADRKARGVLRGSGDDR